ncbi:twinfilin-2 [Caerostris extrusa]|uniref:Twinfilin-2 n=1 Tax=Caerostris extrusa TaxID=172846 RepID=A0AAV4ST85_CAEEX|nr:twinfilin-2 [Caerostris extrusa]
MQFGNISQVEVVSVLILSLTIYSEVQHSEAAMSHQTGIQGSAELKDFFSKCKDGKIRAFKVAIKDEELVLENSRESIGTWDVNYDKLVLPLLEHQQPCYVFYRLDCQNEAGYEWLFISWSPDVSAVRQKKMLYASTKATLKKEFGGGQIKDELFGTQREDVSLKGYKKHVESEKAPQPLSSSEVILQQIKKDEAAGGIDAKHQTMQGVSFPVSDDLINAFCDLKDFRINYLQMSIDMDKEEINLETRMNIDVNSLAENVPSDHARYHLFCLPHSYEGDQFNSVVFIYSVPGYDCPVKERMLYSSCKAPLLNVIENRIGIELAKKIEIDDAQDLTEEFLLDQIHPKQNIFKQKFSKPKGPTNRGARRLLKTQNEDN